MKKWLILLVPLFLACQGTRAANIAQAIWCSGNSTLYFDYAESVSAGSTYHGQTVTKVYTVPTGLYAESADLGWQAGTESVRANATTVEFTEGFKGFKPKSCLGWFYHFSNLVEVNGIGNLNTSEVTTLNYMFDTCEKLVTLDVNTFDVSKVKSAESMFYGCKALTTIYCNQTWTIRDDDGKNTTSGMFGNCLALKGSVKYNDADRNGDMATPKKGMRGGYFTARLSVDSEDSSLDDYNDYYGDITFKNLTLAKDGRWHALCLPFELEQLEGTPLEGATVMELDAKQSNYNTITGELSLSFASSGKIKAGQPYFVKWNTTGANVTSPTFIGVVIDKGNKNQTMVFPEAETPDDEPLIELHGSFKAVAITAQEREQKFVVDNETITQAVKTYQSYSGYFWFPTLLKDGRHVVRTVALKLADATITKSFDWSRGDGSRETPYIISSADDWDLLAQRVSEGNNYSGQYFQMANNISVTTMVGTQETPFAGFFSGYNPFAGQYHRLTFTAGTEQSPFTEDYCAPFRFYAGSNIRMLQVDGDIHTSARYAAGIIAQLSSTAEINSCYSSINIHATAAGETYHSGLIAQKTGYDTEVTFSNCVFNGRLLGEKTTACGGFLTKADMNQANHCGASVKNCMFDPVELTFAGSVANFIYGEPKSITNCYYTQSVGDRPQGSKGYIYEREISGFGTKSVGIVMTTYDKAILYNGKYYSTIAPLPNMATDNSQLLSQLQKADRVDVCLLDRILFKDDKWNTICLPFRVTIAGSVLDGAIARPLKSATVSGTTLNLTFDENVTELEACKPYIIKWTDGADIQDPVFTSVSVNTYIDRSFDNKESGNGRVRYIGNFDAKTFTGAEYTSCLHFTNDMSLQYFQSSDPAFAACRAYFKVGEDGETVTPLLEQFNIDFGDATGIVNVRADAALADGYYTLDGRKVADGALPKGIYIHNGKKVVIK